MDSDHLTPVLADLRTMTIPEPEPFQELSSPVLPDSLAKEESLVVPGYGEPATSDHSLDRIISALVPSFSESIKPIPIPTYLGKEVVTRTSTTGTHSDPSGDGIATRKEPTWSWGLGFELSPIKTRSSRKKAGTLDSLPTRQTTTILEQGALRGMKALAREKS
jgi:hypothetical protein